MKKNKQQELAQEVERELRQQAVEPDLETAPDERPEQPEREEAATASDEAMARLEERLAKSESDFKELSERYMRLMAEYDNYRKRSQKEREALYADSVIAVIKEWLPVIDNLERAQQAALAAQMQDAKPIADGVLLILKQMSETLARLGVREIDCLGKPFDPNLCDAVLHVEDDTIDVSTVIEVLQKGYIRDDRVIRHSIVKVAN